MNEIVDRDEAIERARTLLRHAFGNDMRDPLAGEIILEEQFVTEHDNAWSVSFNSRRYLEEDDVEYAMLPNMITVPKDGHPAHYTPTAIPVEEYLAAVAARKMAWLRPWPDAD